jgi:hypothetical protein
MSYSLTWVDPPEARDDHLAVWERNLPLAVPARQRFDWLYRDNPAGTSRMALLQASSGADGQAPSVVGTAGYGTRCLLLAGQPRPAAVLADLAVDRAHRSLLPAMTLAREVRKEVLKRYPLAYGYPNQHASPLLARIGYRVIGETRRFVLVLRHSRHLAGKTMSGGSARAASLGLDAARAVLVAARAAPVLREYRLRWVSEPDDERFDQLWREAGRQYRLVGVRDAAFVRWRLLRRPEGPLDIAVLTHARTGALAAYAAVGHDGGVAHVRDLFGHERALDPLLRLLSASLLARGAEAVSMRLFGAPALAASLGGLGFVVRADRRSVIVGAGETLGPVPLDVFDADTWYLTDADEDA